MKSLVVTTEWVESSKAWVGSWGAGSQGYSLGTSPTTDLTGGRGGLGGAALGLLLFLCTRQFLFLDLLTSKVLRVPYLWASFLGDLCSFYGHFGGICLEFYLFSTRFNFTER